VAHGVLLILRREVQVFLRGHDDSLCPDGGQRAKKLRTG
jgi:hypothetical protein